MLYFAICLKIKVLFVAVTDCLGHGGGVGRGRMLPGAVSLRVKRDKQGLKTNLSKISERFCYLNLILENDRRLGVQELLLDLSRKHLKRL